ncbi:uncharacterized protein [Mycetomoellerius zeteki]|uniref:uncharacterized protein n=1 Tax=Mycetomoellerius zeteki TaxID=64791 RepID=UPI00084E91A2|nr:PREDICTED: uncharacterized protein LOC108731507 [Trachymyrmex zeteki]
MVAVGTNTQRHINPTGVERAIYTRNLHGHKLPSSVTLPSIPPRLSTCILRQRHRDTSVEELRALEREKGWEFLLLGNQQTLALRRYLTSSTLHVPVRNLRHR